MIDSHTPRVGVVFLPIPDLAATKPSVWFTLFEQALANRNLNSEAQRYGQLVVRLTPALIEASEDIILMPESEKRYELLKQRIISNATPSERDTLMQLFSGLVLGGKKPSELLREMRRLAVPTKLHESFLRELWLQRLPQAVQVAIVANINLNLDQQAAAADAVHERIIPPSIPPTYMCNPLSTDKDKEIEHLRETIAQMSTSDRKSRPKVSLDDLQQQLSDLRSLVTRGRSPGRSPSPRRNATPRRRANSPELDSNGVCWYHKEFGNNARRCKQGCRYQRSRASEN